MAYFVNKSFEQTVMAPLGVSFSLLIEDQGLIKVNLSAILDPFDSNQFMLCPAPFLPVRGAQTLSPFIEEFFDFFFAH